MLRGKRVFARAKTNGSLAVEEGRVEIRYKASDGRAYRATPGNLEVPTGARILPDTTCVEEAPAPSKALKPDHASKGRSLEQKPRVPGSARVPNGWIAYVDGACSGNPGPAGCGVVLVSPDGKMHEGFDYLGEATNNVAELTAILRATEWTPLEAGSLTVHTDSQYSIGVLQKGWKAKANQELVRVTKERVTARGAHLVYVPGHRGIVLNERADELAREAVETRASRRAG